MKLKINMLVIPLSRDNDNHHENTLVDFLIIFSFYLYVLMCIQQYIYMCIYIYVPSCVYVDMKVTSVETEMIMFYGTT